MWRWAWIGLLVLWNAAFVFPLLGPIVHESDQASILEGAVAISHSGELSGQAFYNYDKQFGSYWLVASFLKLLGPHPDPNHVVMMANGLSVAFFNAGLLLFVFCTGSATTLVLLGCLLFSPSFLVHAPFLAGNYLSAFFLFAQFLTLRRSNSPWISLLCAFCATACRADALLAQPVLLWSTTAANTLPGWLRDRRLWACAVAAGAALLLGKLLTLPDANSFSPFVVFLNWKVLIAYSLFGLGAGFFIFLGGMAAISGQFRKKEASALFTLAGLGSLALPFAYYLLNLYSTRHWTVALAALMCFVASARGQKLIDDTFRPKGLRAAFLALLVLMAGLPIFLGLRLSALAVPRLTLSRPTLIPSADGLIPLGAYLARAWGWDRDQRLIHDHNQATWLAALNADIGSLSPVPLVPSPLVNIFRLAVTLRGFKYEVLDMPSPLTKPVFTEFRALRKTPMSHFAGKMKESPRISRGDYGVEFASPLVAGEAIVRLIPSKNELAEELRILHEEFSGNDYHLRRLGVDEISSFPDAAAGHLMILFSRSPFRLHRGAEILIPEKRTIADGHDYYLLRLVAAGGASSTLEGEAATVAVSVLPTFMNVESY